MIGEITGFFGPTGSGKTTRLNQIAAEFSEKYKISYGFQDNRLLPELSVKKNISLPLENALDKKKAEEIAEKWMKIFDLELQKNQKAKALSGGEAQRVNLARAFAWNGDVFLFDEPFSSQDENHKKIIMENIKELSQQKKTIVLVSHNRQDLVDLNCKIVEF